MLVAFSDKNLLFVLIPIFLINLQNKQEMQYNALKHVTVIIMNSYVIADINVLMKLSSEGYGPSPSRKRHIFYVIIDNSQNPDYVVPHS